MAKTKKSAAGRQNDAGDEPVAARPARSSRHSGRRSSERDPEAADPEAEGLSFEGALERLEETVGRLEEGEMPLEEALALFEQGVKLSRQCTTTLEAAERRVEVLVAGRGGDQIVAPFDSEPDSEPDADLEPDEEDEDFE